MVTLKYVLIVLRADNEGEGGTFSCYSLLTRYVSGLEGNHAALAELLTATIRPTLPNATRGKRNSSRWRGTTPRTSTTQTSPSGPG